MLKIQESEVWDLEILANEEMIIRRKERMGLLRVGPLGNGMITKNITTGRKITGKAMSPVAVPCSDSCSVP